MSMLRPKHIIFLLLPLLCACHELPEQTDTPIGNFDQLWTILDEHYCFFAEKDVDWNEVYATYRPRVSNDMTDRELFDLCAEMLDLLRDGHTNLASSFNVSYYTRWWSDYPQNYSERLVEQNYFNFGLMSAAGLQYGLLSENVGYIRYSSFADAIGEGNIDQVLAYLATATALIIDIRDNGGGDMSNVEMLVARFIDRPILAGYISHKSGPGHDDFSEPRPYNCYPAAEGRMRWGKPVAVLTNRSTFSAANNFVSVMKYVPGCRIVGATTGGGSGMPFNSELSNGWSVRFSACPVLDTMGNPTEQGIEPSEGCAVDLDPELALQGRDSMLDFAINLLTR